MSKNIQNIEYSNDIRLKCIKNFLLRFSATNINKIEYAYNNCLKCIKFFN